MPDGYLLCRDNHSKYYWVEEGGEVESAPAISKWWVRRDAIFHSRNGYSYEEGVNDEGYQKLQQSNKDVFFKEFTKDLHTRIVGECKQCGLCCRENWRFDYSLILGESITSDYKTEPPKDYKPCEIFNTETNTCTQHGENKIPVCKYWPLLETDLDQIDCPGYKIMEES
jgi:hypothetical protein